MVIEKIHNTLYSAYKSLDSLDTRDTVKQINSDTVILAAEQSNDDVERSFRERYAQELKNKKQQIYDKYRGFNELDDERRSVRQQMMRTPGRRGEIIKEEELSKEFSRRFSES